MLTTTTNGTEIDLRAGDLVKLRGLTIPMRVVMIDALAIVTLRREINGVEESGMPYRQHIGDIAIETLYG